MHSMFTEAKMPAEFEVALNVLEDVTVSAFLIQAPQIGPENFHARSRELGLFRCVSVWESPIFRPCMADWRPFCPCILQPGCPTGRVYRPPTSASFYSRNIGEFTRKIIYCQYVKNIFWIKHPKKILLVLKTEALPPTLPYEYCHLSDAASSVVLLWHR